jgi:beta-lactamase class A
MKVAVMVELFAQARAKKLRLEDELPVTNEFHSIVDGIPAGLPAGTVVAHKTGEITRIHHDAAIVYGPRPYVLVVLVRGVPERRTSAALIASIARAVHDAVR